MTSAVAKILAGSDEIIRQETGFTQSPSLKCTNQITEANGWRSDIYTVMEAAKGSRNGCSDSSCSTGSYCQSQLLV